VERLIAPTTFGDSLLTERQDSSRSGGDVGPNGGALTSEGGVPPEGSGDSLSSANRTSVPLWVRFCEELVASALEETSSSADVRGALEEVYKAQIAGADGSADPAEVAGRAVLASHRMATELRERSVAAGFSERALRTPISAPSTSPPPPVLAPPAQLHGAITFSPTSVEHATSPHGVPEGQSPSTDPRLGRFGTLYVAFGWVRNIGFVLLLFAAWQLWGTAIEHAHAQETLRQEFQAKVHHVVTHSISPVLISANTRLSPPEGSVVGHLQIPAIGVDQYVVEGTTEGDLAKGPGHYIGTAMPGQSGNVAIAGHRTTYGAPFNELNELKVDDRIVLTTDTGSVLTYVVSQAPVAVSPGDVAVLNSFDDNRLTLTTCNPRFSASQRLVVVALLSEPQAVSSTTVAVSHQTLRIVTGTTGWNFDYLPEAAGALVLLFLLGLYNGWARRVFGRLGRLLVLTPIWVGGLFLLFVALTQLLPANL
jgi:sortase A